jgi:transposase-like protein
MVLLAVRCPYCHSDQIIKRGKTDTNKQRYRCQNPACPHQSFVLDPAYKGRRPDIKQQGIEISLKASGIRDTACVLQISTDTVIKELKKKGAALQSVNQPLLHTLDPHDLAGFCRKVAFSRVWESVSH